MALPRVIRGSSFAVRLTRGCSGGCRLGLFLRAMMADRAARCCAGDAMMAREVAGHAAYHCTFGAASGLRGRLNAAQRGGECEGRANVSGES